VRYVFLPVAWAGPRLGQLVFQMLLPVVSLWIRPDLWIDSLTPPFSASLVPFNGLLHSVIMSMSGAAHPGQSLVSS